MSNDKKNMDDVAIEIRNKSWGGSSYIPSWVKVENVGLDQFFTRPSVAKACWESFCKHLKEAGVDILHYNFIEPSAGLGAFYDLLPDNRRIGVDVANFRPEYIQNDFLSWTPKKNGYRYACIGNPPFGHRAWLALAFMNHASKFSDYVGFIVPMAFQSRGKSNVQDRVIGLQLIHSSLLPQDSFIDANGNSLKVNALWQIWGPISDTKKTILKNCDNYIDLFTVEMHKARICGQKRLHEADFFLQRTFYKEPPSLVTSFEQVKYACGYGIVIKKEKQKVLDILNSADWKHYSNLASHNCRHISMGHIRAVLIDAGLIDV